MNIAIFAAGVVIAAAAAADLLILPSANGYLWGADDDDLLFVGKEGAHVEPPQVVAQGFEG